MKKEIIIICILLFILGIIFGTMINEEKNKKTNKINETPVEIITGAEKYFKISDSVRFKIPINWSLFKKEENSYSFINSDTSFYLEKWKENGSLGFGWIIDTMNIKKINVDEYNEGSFEKNIIELKNLSYYKTTGDSPLTMDRDSINIFYIKFDDSEVYKLLSAKDVGNNLVAENIINSLEVLN